jgi:hypothetical protein
LYRAAVTVVPASFDVDFDTLILLTIVLVVVLLLGVGWILGGRRR